MEKNVVYRIKLACPRCGEKSETYDLMVPTKRRLCLSCAAKAEVVELVVKDAEQL